MRRHVVSILLLLVVFTGCTAVNGILPDRLGVGHTFGYVESADMPGWEIEQRDRDVRATNIYLEWDIPQIGGK